MFAYRKDHDNLGKYLIVNGDSPPLKRTVNGVEQTYPPTTAEEKLARKNELKARGTLLMALPNEHQLKFNTYKCSKTLMEAIEKRLQKLISQLEILGETISQEDMNLKFLRSLLSEWKTHTLIWRNKPDLDTLSMDDLFNNLKIYETKVKGSSRLNQNSQNVAFVSSSNFGSSNQAHGSNSANTDSMSDAIDVDDLEEMDLKWQMAMLTMRARRFLNKTGRKISANGSETIGFNKSKVKCYNYHKRGHFAREYRDPRENWNIEPIRRNVTVETTETKALVAQDGLGYDWSDQAEEGPTNFALMAYTSSGSSSSSSSDSEVSTCSKACLKYYETLKEHYDNLTKDFNKSQLNIGAYKAGLESIKARLVMYKKNEVIFEEDIKILKLDIKLRDNVLTELRKKFEKAEKERDDLKLTLKRFDSQVVNSQVVDSQENDRYKTSERYHVVLPPYTGNFISLKSDLVLADEDEYVFSVSVTSIPDVETSKAKTSMSKPKYVSEPLIEDWISDNEDKNETEESVKKVENNEQAKYLRKNNQSPRAAVSINTARPINTAYPKPTVNCARGASNVFNRAHSHVRRPFNKFTSNKNSNFNKKVNTVEGNVTTVRPKAVVSDEANAVKASTCWIQVCNGLGPQESLHMTENKSYLSDYKEINGGFVAFGGDPKGGRITGKGKISTDTKCVVLSPNFKLLDENHVLLRVPRKDNMYSVDLKNIVPSGGLTCLFAKATLDESNLWHRRLGHINFKTMNKLVRGNLVRGLPSKIFENNHTCVACQKGKQHKASCKTKTVSSISQPLQMLHMDLFGPTFVKSLMKKMYCLVVTDDYSRFSWVFFLATKDETSEILKTFITGIENLIDLKVKVIRCDNGTEFKNKVMNQFCEMKGIKREFSVARTPQQNGVAERKNRTLIEAARTMLADSKLPTTF
ncbi:putative ribonuclease H-like domain-containing protein [Tanacetum coccineum]